MEALTISQANLNTIEQNMAIVAKELNGIIDHIDEVNAKVNNVESKMGGINGEINNIIEEIRANTIINNARQSIIYNNSIIEKKFGYYDILRRNVESLIENLMDNTLREEAISKLKNSITMNNPNYWLGNATLAIIYWLLDNHIDSEIELKKALKKDQEKTSLLMIMLQIIFNRQETAIHWLEYYLNHQDPSNIKPEFITVLDLVSSGYLGTEGENILTNKIKQWINKLSSSLKDSQTQKWIDKMNSYKKNETNFNYITDYAVNKEVISNNYSIFEANHQLDNFLDSIIHLEKESKNIDKVILNLIYDYEDSEKTYQLDNLRNELLIQTNGNKTEAEKLFSKQQGAYQDNTDILSLFYNIINQTDKYDISANSVKLALIFQKNYISKAMDYINQSIKETEISFHIDEIYASTIDGENLEKVNKDIKNYAEAKYIDNDKTLIIISIIISVIGLIAVLIASNNTAISIITLAIILIVNSIIINKLNKRSHLLEQQKNSYIEGIYNILEKNFAECTDYHNKLLEEKIFYNETKNKLQDLKIDNVIVIKDRKIHIDR